MKYVNPHTVLLAYFSPKKTPTETGTGAGASAETPSSEGSPLYAAVVDTVSSKILYRVLLCNTASAPVHALLVENHVIVTYWNAKAKRTELSSTALYEGMVDVFGLSPLSYFAALPQQIRDANLSSFTSPIPLGIQRTYVIPRMVTSLHHTITSRGMTCQHQYPMQMPL
jgi:ER membrane protein complex subunit 1, C-terminal